MEIRKSYLKKKQQTILIQFDCENKVMTESHNSLCVIVGKLALYSIVIFSFLAQISSRILSTCATTLTLFFVNRSGYTSARVLLSPLTACHKTTVISVEA